MGVVVRFSGATLVGGTKILLLIGVATDGVDGYEFLYQRSYERTSSGSAFFGEVSTMVIDTFERSPPVRSAGFD
jgi:hypothetical protein